MTTISIDEAGELLLNHHRLFAPQLMQKLQEELETEKYMVPVKAQDRYIQPTVSGSNFIQAYKCQFSPKGNINFDYIENVLDPMKVDLQFTCAELNKLFHSWKSEWIERGKSMLEWTFPKYIWETVIIPQVAEELENITWHGEKVAPTDDAVAGPLLGSADGLLKKISDGISASDLTPIPTGSLGPDTIVDQLEAFFRGIPEPYRTKKMNLYTSKTNVIDYQFNYRDKFGPNTDYNGPIKMISNSNITIIGVAGLAGSDRLVATTPRNFLRGTRIGESDLPVIRWQEFERVLKGLSEFHRFWGFGMWDEVFVNDVDEISVEESS